MTPLLLRYLRFSLVGAMGVAVQLSALALLNRLAPGHYLYASAAALELTLLHNFAWHLRYTWADRSQAPNGLVPSHAAIQLARFHLSNGLVSFVGNLTLMRLLVHSAHLPVLDANAIAILCCSAINFYLSHTWAFASTSTPHGSRTRAAPTARST